MPAALVSLATAKEHLRLTTPAGDPGDADIQRKLDQAEGIIRDYLKSRVDPLWLDEASTPAPVQAAILLMLGHLRENRGDADMKTDEALWRSIERLLVRLRDPALA